MQRRQFDFLPPRSSDLKLIKKKDDNKDIDLDAILVELGDFGRYQKLVYAYLGLAIVFTAIYNCNYVFAAGMIEYRCRVPQCDSSPANFTPGDWKKFALPAKGANCYKMVPVGSSCEPGSFANRSQPCTSWVYENQDTIVHEFGLACQEWKRTLVGTIHNAGVFVATPLTAIVSDAYGRRVALIGTCVLPAIVGVVRGALCNDYYVYLVLEFIEALVGAGTYSSAFILGLEMVGLKKRVIGGNTLSCMFAVGQAVTAVAAWAIPYWRTFTIVIFAPSFLFIVYCFFVEESVRWLLVKGKRKEAVRIILKAAAINKVNLLPNTVQLLSDKPNKNDPRARFTQTYHPLRPPIVEVTKKEPPLFRQVLRSKIILFRLCVCSFWWVSVTMIYYGLSINSVSLMGDKYVNFIMTSFVEIPGYMLGAATLDRFGRKSAIMTSFFICGISLLSLPVITSQTLLLILTLVGKMMISLIFCSVYIYTIELFPTQGRHMLISICSMTGRIGSMTAPQTPLLVVYHKSLPYVLFGGMAGTAGLLMLLTPETLHIKLPDTIAQAEHIETATRTRATTDLIVDRSRRVTYIAESSLKRTGSQTSMG